MLELNKLYNMDCMQGMKEFPDGFFDLAIVDPPYGIGIDGQKKRVCGNPKGDSIEFTTPEIVGQFIKRSDGLWKAENVAEPTNSVATAWFTSVREPNNAGG